MNSTKSDSIETCLDHVLGYLNFSSGSDDAAFLANIDQLFQQLDGNESSAVHNRLQAMLSARLQNLAANNKTFRDCEQAENVIRLVFDRTLPQYLAHHRDLLFHHTQASLFNGYMVGRVCQAVLKQGAPWGELERVVQGAIDYLNDYIGHRPVAALETRKLEPYDSEWIRPIPIFIRDVGPAFGPYRQIVEKAIDILRNTDSGILQAAQFSLEQLDELAIDPRAFDFDHPVTRRPNHHFGQWDEHQINQKGYFSRFVVHQVTLDSLLDRLETEKEISKDELVVEASAVLAGTILMASGICGRGPGAYDSETTLESLLPTIAHYRDAFYEHLIQRLSGEHRERLQAEATARRQPFGGARQHLNAQLAERRASQLINVHLASIYARMGYMDSAKKQANIVPVASARMTCQIDCLLSAGLRSVKNGELEAALGVVPEIFDLLQRAIHCGAIVDPWNILGFDGHYSLFPAQSNSVRDHRVDELVSIVEQTFALLSQLWSEAAIEQPALCDRIESEFESIVRWWNQYAAHEVHSVGAANPNELLKAAHHVAKAMHLWHQGGAAAGDVKFWAKHAKMFDSAEAHSLVIDALLQRNDMTTAMALLVHWLSQAQHMPLDHNDGSFHELMRRWIIRIKREAVESGGDMAAIADRWSRIRKFHDYIEANAEEYWVIPQFQLGFGKRTGTPDDSLDPDFESEETDEDDIYRTSSREGMSYVDSTDDGIEGEIFDSSLSGDDELEAEVERVAERLDFLSTIAYFWRIAATFPLPVQSTDAIDDDAKNVLRQRREIITQWVAQAAQNKTNFSILLQSVFEYRLPTVSGDHESLIQYDRCRLYKESLLDRIISAAVETENSLRMLAAVVTAIDHLINNKPLEQPSGPISDQRHLVAVFAAIMLHSPSITVEHFPALIEELHQHSLLYVPLAKGGDPHEIVAARTRQDAIKELLTCLPKLGLLAETFELTETALAMERNHNIGAGAVTEFDELFKFSYISMVESLIRSTQQYREQAPAPISSDDQKATEILFECLEFLTESMLIMWLDHSRTLRLSVLEKVSDDTSWQRLVDFIRDYGGDLFTQQFLHLANVRAILHQGVETWFEQLEQLPEGEEVRLIRELDQNVPRQKAVRYLTLVLEAVIENYNEYRDYNSTTTQSDRGDLLFMLLDFLRLSGRYNRVCWHLRPVIWAHQMLVRSQENAVGRMWRRSLTDRIGPEADKYLDKFEQLQKKYSMQMTTVKDRLSERFVDPLRVDRLRSLVKPAMEDPTSESSMASFEILAHEANTLASRPTGIGVDLPVWLSALEEEVEQCHLPDHLRSDLEHHCLIEPSETPLDELRRQLQELPRR